MSRLSGRLRIFSRALPRLLLKPWRREPRTVGRVLIAHRLLLGDTLLLAPLLKKVREQHPDAAIVLTCPPAVAPLFACRPYGATALPYDPRSAASIARIVASGPYDLAIVAGDQRYAWLALAADSRWIVAYQADTPAWKRWPIDALPRFPDSPVAWADALALLVRGAAPGRFDPTEWPMPAPAPFAPPPAGYVVLHPGASNPVKQWPAARWLALADTLTARGWRPVWSGGPGEGELIAQIDPERRYPSYAEQLDLAQLAALLRGAKLLVCPDTGVAHLGRLLAVPTLALFGPGSARVHGAGQFWDRMPFVAETVDIACRDQPTLFESTVSWIRRCDRDLATCRNRRGAGAACMSDISEAVVKTRLDTLIDGVR
ncbi:glycosyltransferase family 9 protein [Robbsia sp. Bb-Pol-6]|uniref:Glycosyltransferase family 9 protein n=1 Tax=Robbsia betulipollinis TaxID=2981849 RepID=A0ABT3ZMS4_9BURK|nr:glycosyltransferase family 9 protein [Robbsia betulipollinis]MCY0387712.1 glycosyltransferase family 9 protein [Robbsia betulipollinis]